MTTKTAQFTPGPWRAQVNRVKDYVSVFPIQVCIEESPLSDETIANATLIAAAPAMYEALQSILAEVTNDTDGLDTAELYEIIYFIRGKAKSALAQAEGRQS